MSSSAIKVGSRVRFINPDYRRLYGVEGEVVKLSDDHCVLDTFDSHGSPYKFRLSNVQVVKEGRADTQAFKADAGKPRFELLMDGCPDALLDVVKVLTWAVQEKKDAPWPEGGKGYVPHSWQEVTEAKRRYRAALQRHENAIARGELNDPESGLPHRAHVATNALFLAQLDYIKE